MEKDANSNIAIAGKAAAGQTGEVAGAAGLQVKSNVSSDPAKRSRKGVAGRKSRFLENKEYYIQMAKQYARDGLIDREIAAKFGIHKSTLYRWMKQCPELRETMKVNKAIVDSQVVDTTIKAIHGFEYEETKVIADANGKVIQIIKHRKFIPPNSTLIIFWLKNRLGWRDNATYEHVHSGEIKVTNAKHLLHEKLIKVLVSIEKEEDAGGTTE